MKNKLFFIAVILLISCSKEEENQDVNGLKFKNQELQGSIDGESWKYESGRIKRYIHSSIRSTYVFAISGKLIPDTCISDSLLFQPYSYKEAYITFEISSYDSLLQPVKLKSFFDHYQFAGGLTIETVSYESGINEKLRTNYFSEGIIEILSFNHKTNIVKGQLVARMTEPHFGDSELNGQFEAVLCTNE